MINVSKCLLPFVLLLLLLTGCSARKSAMGDSPSAMASSLALLPSANSNVEYLTSTLKINASVGNKDLSVKGKLRVKEDDGAQISVTPLGLIEAACIELLPRTLKFIYKIDKVYIDAPYADISLFGGSGTDYKLLESVLLNRMFSPDGTPLKKALKGMKIVKEGEYITATTSDKHSVVYKFYIDGNGNLVKSEGSYASGLKAVCRYSDFTELDGVPFPQSIELSFSGNGTPVTLVLKMSNVRSDEFDFSPRNVSSSYRAISLERMIELIGK